MYDFAYHKPSSLAEAVKLLADPEAKALSGGQTLLPALKHRLNRPSSLVDLTGIAEMKGIRREGDTLVVGALSRHADIQDSDVVRQAIPALARMAGHLGDTQVRNRGTIGGSLANNDPAADYPAAALALGARFVTDRREIGADEFFQGMFTTALEPDELVVALRFPVPEKAGYAKMRHPASRFALTGVFVTKTKGGDVRVAATGASQSGVMRVPAIEAALKSNWSASAIDGVTVSASGLLSDIHGSSDYRANLVKVMAQRAVQAAG